MARTGSLIDRARAAGVPVLYVQDEEDLPRDSPEWQLAPPLLPLPDEPLVFRTYRDFFVGTNLEALLEQRRISRLLIAGEQVVAHTIHYFGGLRYPPASIGVATHDTVTF